MDQFHLVICYFPFSLTNLGYKIVTALSYTCLWEILYNMFQQ